MKRIQEIFLLLAGVIFICSGAGLGGSVNGKTDFNLDWQFHKDEVAHGQSAELDDSGWRRVALGHDWSIEGPYSSQWAAGTGFLPGGIGWYRKHFALDSQSAGKIVRICFDGVYKKAEVWINGHYLGKRPYGYVPFSYNISRWVYRDGRSNLLAVKVDHSDYADSRWYTGSGIYRPVRLTLDEMVHIAPEGVYVTTPAVSDRKATIEIETELINSERQTRTIELLARIGNGTEEQTAVQVGAGQRQTVRQRIVMMNPRRWSVERPSLYHLESVVRVGGKVMDRVETVFGIRTIEFNPDHGFKLNGEQMKIKGICVHHGGGPVGAAVPKVLWRDRLKRLKDIGCNAIRMAHNPPATELLELCDEMGFLVMDEAFDEFTPPKRKWVEGWNAGEPSYDGYGKDGFASWSVRDIEAMVRRDRNHPSIILWSIGNEIDYANDPYSHPSMGKAYSPKQPRAEELVKWGRPLVEAVKRLDLTRPVTAAMANTPVSNIVGYAELLDVAGYNYQEKYYAQDHRRYPERCIIGSENSKRLAAWQAVTDNDFVAGQFLWVGFDFLGESRPWPVKCSQSGLFDLCGHYKSWALLRKSLWSKEPMAALCVRPSGQRRGGLVQHWNGSEGQEMEVVCYSNCERVDLLLNGRSLGEKTADQKKDGMLVWTTHWQSGELKAIGYVGGHPCEFSLKTAGQPERIVLNGVESDSESVLVRVSVVDQNGVIVPDAETAVRLRAKNAILKAVGTGNPAGHEDHQSQTLRVWQGRGLAVFDRRMFGPSETVQITAEAAGLKSARLAVQ